MLVTHERMMSMSLTRRRTTSLTRMCSARIEKDRVKSVAVVSNRVGSTCAWCTGHRSTHVTCHH